MVIIHSWSFSIGYRGNRGSGCGEDCCRGRRSRDATYWRLRHLKVPAAGSEGGWIVL